MIMKMEKAIKTAMVLNQDDAEWSYRAEWIDHSCNGQIRVFDENNVDLGVLCAVKMKGQLTK